MYICILYRLPGVMRAALWLPGLKCWFSCKRTRRLCPLCPPPRRDTYLVVCAVVMTAVQCCGDVPVSTPSCINGTGKSPPLSATRRTPHGASCVMQAIPVWSVKTLGAPYRNCGARVYGHTTSAMHDMRSVLSHTPVLSRYSRWDYFCPTLL